MVFWESQHRTRRLHSAGIMECAVFLCVDGSYKIPQTPVCRINEVCVCVCGEASPSTRSRGSRSPCDPLTVTYTI